MVQTAQEALRPWLESAVNDARTKWLADLTSLFLNIQNYFPDLIWETEDGQEIMGHAAMVYARTKASTLQSWSVLRPTLSYLVASTNPNARRIKVPGEYDTVEQEVRSVYTGRAIRATSITESGIQNLEKDLVDMWRSRMYSDVRITLILPAPEDQIAIFYGHRFLLASRSKFFNNAFCFSERKDGVDEPVTISLPEQIFTVTSIQVILGYLCAGTLNFSAREYDLATALAIYKGSVYLSLPTLQKLVLANLTVQMNHGLFHATLLDEEYIELVGPTWITMVQAGCRCNSCAHRIPCILEFASTSEDPYKNDILERGARRAILGIFGEGWCTKEFAALPSSLIDSTLDNFGQMITPETVFPMLFAADLALLRLQMSSEPWAELVKAPIITARSLVEDVLYAETHACFKWEKVIDSKNTIFSPRDVVWIASAIFRCGRPHQIPGIYQSIVGVMKKFPPSDADIVALIQNTKEKLRKAVDLASLSQSPNELTENDTYGADHRASSINSNSGSVYSLVSTIDTIRSLEDPLQDSGRISAFDLAPSSLYSSASSRTLSTDYGIYFRRMALSSSSNNGSSNSSVASAL